MSEPLKIDDDGIYCATSDFYIDPWRPVPRAVVTHAHADHARRGCRSYLTTIEGRGVLARRRVGPASRHARRRRRFRRDDRVRRGAFRLVLTREEWDWVIQFLVTGGSALTAHPEYRKLVLQEGRYLVDDPQVAKRRPKRSRPATATGALDDVGPSSLTAEIRREASDQAVRRLDHVSPLRLAIVRAPALTSKRGRRYGEKRIRRRTGVRDMTIVRTGSNQKFASGWEAAFGGAKKATAPTPAKKSAKKAAPKKSMTQKVSAAAPAKKSVTQKTAPKKAAAAKPTTQKVAPAKKAAAKKSAPKKSVTKKVGK